MTQCTSAQSTYIVEGLRRNQAEQHVEWRICAVKPTLSLFAVSFLALFFTTGLQAQPSAPTVTQLFAFACDSTGKVCPDGEYPNSLLQSADGNFYGTTLVGGGGNVSAGGTIFKITPAGKFTLLYTFVADQNGKYSNGCLPNSLVEGNDGFLYGTTLLGGPANTGLVFKLSKKGKFQVLNSAVGYNGFGPSTLLVGRDGKLYGGTFGTNVSGGSLFRVTPSGAYTLLHVLNPTVEGPMTLGMTLASDGNFYGATLGGEELLTTVYRLTPSGQFTTLQTIHYGQTVVSPPIQASNGKIYGGLSRYEDQAEPSLFASNLSGSDFEDILLPQLVYGDDVQYMTQASDSNLWCVMVDYDLNTIEVVSLSLSGTLLQTVTFDGANGEYPDAALVQGSDGRLFGVAQLGGTVQQGETANGVVFALDAGLAAPKPELVIFNPSRGKVGTHVAIHGTQFVGTTAVTFNGVSATFKVLNGGYIVATVPQGATTGPISVTNPGGMSASRRDFTVE
jgi:uncharacterized repeat protein (TIGR03803 family)